MPDRPTEPRRLTLADLMVLVAGVGIALELPVIRGYPTWFPNKPGAQASIWLSYLAEQTARIGFALCLLALVRADRFGRSIRAPEFLLLSLIWHGQMLAFVEPEEGWLEFYTLEFTPEHGRLQIDRQVIETWHACWFAVGCFGAICLLLQPIRKRLPLWLVACLLLLTYHGFAYHLEQSGFESWVRALAGPTWTYSRWAYHLLTATIVQLPLAAALVAFRSAKRDRWTVSTWLAFLLALTSIGMSVGVELIERFVWERTHYSSDRLWWRHAIKGVVLPPVALAIGIAITAVGRRSRSLRTDR